MLACLKSLKQYPQVLEKQRRPFIYPALKRLIHSTRREYFKVSAS